MPWKETCPVSERKSLIEDHLKGRYSHAELCRRYGVSRKTGYKWIDRFAAQGAAGLMDRSRAARHHPNQTPASIVDRLLEFKHAHPKWGAYAIVHRLRRDYPDEPWPAVSTVGGIFKHHGLVRSGAARRRVPPHSEPLRHATTPSSVWSADYKGDFLMGNGRRCYPLTISDNYSRFLICCQGMHRISLKGAQCCYIRAFERFGLPEAIRTDNGHPFANCTLGGLNELSIWLLKLNVVPERIAPASPQQNPRHERMHRTLKYFAIDPAKGNLSAQQRAFNRFRDEYNHQRPHQALGGDTPADAFQCSPRPLPSRTPTPQYEDSLQVRRVRRDGYIKWRGRSLYLSANLAHEPVGLLQLDNDCWQIYFARLCLGVLDERLQCILIPD